MSRQPQLPQWTAELSSRFPQLSPAVVNVLALYSLGMILAKVSGLAAVVLFLTQHLGLAADALRKRLREFYLDAHDKSGVKQGVKRRDFDVTTTFAPLLRWLLSLWEGKHLPLAIDVTNLGDRFHVLCVSVVVRGLALPVAWKVLHGGLKEPWNPHWQQLLTALKDAVPDDWTVLVLSDRGLESPALFRAIVALGWHPLMRIKKGSQFRPTGWRRFYPLTQLVPRVGASLQLTGRAYAGTQLRCTLLARWEEGYQEPWLVLTDLLPTAADAVWYGLRTWIEQGFKVIKSGGWSWDRTRMEDPERVERLWLALAVATVWVVALGSDDEVQQAQRADEREWERRWHESAEQAEARAAAERARRAAQAAGQRARQERREKLREAKKTAARAKQQAQAAQRHPASGATAQQRSHRVSVRGLAVLTALWARGENRLPQHLHPQPWPISVHATVTLTEEDFLAQQT